MHVSTQQLSSKSKVLWACLLALSLESCVSSAHPLPPNVSVEATSGNIVLGASDVCEIKVFDEPDLSGTFRVGNDGSFDFPLLGPVRVKGMTPEQATETLTTSLRRYLKNPFVSIYLKESASAKIFVFGEVRTPGAFPFQHGMTLVHAITLAGGLSQYADDGSTSVTRYEDGKERRQVISVSSIRDGKQPNFDLRPGDIVYVPQTIF